MDASSLLLFLPLPLLLPPPFPSCLGKRTRVFHSFSVYVLRKLNINIDGIQMGFPLSPFPPFPSHHISFSLYFFFLPSPPSSYSNPLPLSKHQRYLPHALNMQDTLGISEHCVYSIVFGSFPLPFPFRNNIQNMLLRHKFYPFSKLSSISNMSSTLAMC